MSLHPNPNKSLWPEGRRVETVEGYFGGRVVGASDGVVNMSPQVTEALGWVATSVFVASYFFARPATLRAVRMVGAVL